jgi:hypothetical protein
MCEDFEENPVFLFQREAKYEEIRECGHVYVIGSKWLQDQNIEVHDLTSSEVDGGLLRFHVQHACLAGGRDGELPHESIIAHLEIGHQALVDFYREDGINSVLDVFPVLKGSASDFFLVLFHFAVTLR